MLDYLHALAKQSVCILLVTSCDDLTDAAWQKLKGKVWRAVTTTNRARDFGLYFTGVRLLGDELSGHPIILTNDSVIGTMNRLDPLFAAARSGEADITGAIDCWLHDWHLQSFFLYCTAETVASPTWKAFWTAYRPHGEKWFVINSHEFGFSRFMVKNNMRVASAWKYDTIARETVRTSSWRNAILDGGLYTNPTIELWDSLLADKFPFLKKQLVTEGNSTGNQIHLCNVISEISAKTL